MTVQNYSVKMAGELVAETVPYDDVEILGTAGGRQYARDGKGRELWIRGTVQPWEVANPVKPGEVHIERREVVKDRSMAFPEARITRVRAQLVEPGTFVAAEAREDAKAEMRRRQENPPLRRVDLLALSPLLARQEPWILPATEAGDPLRPTLTGRTAPLIASDGRPAIRGPEAIIAMLERKGIRLQLSGPNSRLEVLSRKGRAVADVRSLVQLAEPLVRAHLLGQPLRCEAGHPPGEAPPAVTLVEPDAMPCCEQHLVEELEP